jgi:hypothetical protein
MALNQNHTCEELDGVKCSIIEKNCPAQRSAFLKELLEHNKFTVVVAASPALKAAPKPVVEGEAPVAEAPAPPSTFTVGVTDLSFNTVNAIYNRELVTKEGVIVTPAFWKQLQSVSDPESWYWKK